jgi:multidrug transporter EmrE-like cation transporter
MVPFYGCAGQSWEFLCLLFGIPTLTCAAESGVRREGVLGAAIVIGVILGVTNVLSVSASLQGLRTIPSVLFFPVYSCGGVLLNALAAVVLWRERLTRLNGIGIAVVCLALVFMNPGR